jgi:hypothetical protein
VSALHDLLGPLYPVIDWPMNTGKNGGYNFWSGIAGQSAIGYFLLKWRSINCAAPRCLRIGRHPTADGQHHLCRIHHPDLPRMGLSLHEIHRRHNEAKHGGR